MEVFKISRQLVLECYQLTKIFPAEERFALSQQIRRAGLSVHLNIAEGCSRKSKAERKRFFEISRGSIVEIDTAIDIAVDLNYSSQEKFPVLGKCILDCFKMLSNMLR
jgi:four helix bundle protein